VGAGSAEEGGTSVEDVTVRGLTSACTSLPDGLPLLGLVDNPLMPRGTRLRRAIG
jgi:hypothetical protein